VTAFGAMSAIAQADALHGGPTKNGNQCFNYAGLVFGGLSADSERERKRIGSAAAVRFKGA
jgi:hypothetical protein